MSKPRYSYEEWYKKVAGYWNWRREEEEKVNEMKVHEFIAWLKEASDRQLATCMSFKLSTWKRWLLLHEMAHRILHKLLPQYEIVEKGQES